MAPTRYDDERLNDWRLIGDKVEEKSPKLPHKSNEIPDKQKGQDISLCLHSQIIILHHTTKVGLLYKYIAIRVLTPLSQQGV